MEEQTKTVVVKPEDFEGKSPLASKTVQLAVLTLVTGVISKTFPAAGEWIKANSDTILLVLPALFAMARSKADRPIDWKNWTLFGVGKQF